MADILDILDIEIPGASEISRDSIIHGDRNKKKYVTTKAVKRPEGMHREVFALLYNDNKELPPMLPTDTGIWPWKIMYHGLAYKPNSAIIAILYCPVLVVFDYWYTVLV